VPKIELGRIGAAIAPETGKGLGDTAARLEDPGYATIWVTGGPMTTLDQIAEVVRATKQVRVASGIISVDRFVAEEVAGLYTDLEAGHPGRFVVGLGGAHGSHPLATLARYLDELDSLDVPPARRALAALGPRMLDLARERAGVAFPVLVTPEYTAEARARLGADTTLAVEQLVVVESDPRRARAAARGPLGFLGRVPAYQANFRRMGFGDGEITQVADRLVDALVVWGNVDAIAERVSAHLQAGADHVALSVTGAGPDVPALDQWGQLADRLIAT
jgi:probable F420-dependent oxidoreductase